MKPEIIDLPALKIAGLQYIGKNQNNEIGSLWGQFMPFIDGPYRTDPHTSYGICLAAPKGSEEGAFRYIACVEVATDAAIPKELITEEIPPLRYAVFKHVGDLAKLRETYHNIYSTWL